MSTKLALFLLLLTITESFSYNLQPANLQPDTVNTEISEESQQAKVRQKRGIFWDFFQKIVTTKNLIVDQYVDTKNTLNHVYNLLNDDFLNPGPVKPTVIPTTTEAPRSIITRIEDTEVKTTTEKYRISRYEFGQILGRNFRGLKRLSDIELNEALQDSKLNIKEYQEEARKQFSNSIAVDLKTKLKTG